MSYGNTYELFDKRGGASITTVFQTTKRFNKDRYLNVYYHEIYRIKNHKNKRFNGMHNEALKLSFDSNLSTDFTHTDLNIATGESFTISLVGSNQRDYGDTQLFMSLQYVSKNQELHDTTATWICPTIQGSISKKLKYYRAEFQQAIQHYNNKYLENGPTYHAFEKVKALASYLYLKSRSSTSTNYYDTRDFLINKILIIYSILSDDCFEDMLDRKTGFELNSSPYYYHNGYEDLQKVRLIKKDEDFLDCLYIFFKENRKLVDSIFSESVIKFWSGDKYDYWKIKELVKAKLAIEGA